MSDKKNVIITGGTGLIGQALSKSLVDDGYEVTVLSRNPSGKTVPGGVNITKWDAKTADGWGELADGAYAIVNLAGANIADGLFRPWNDKRKELILSSRLNAGQAVVSAVREAKNKPQVVLQASAVGYYGDRRADILTENSRAGSDFPAEVSKQWEPSTAEVEEMGVRRVTTRIGVVFSMDGGALPKLVTPFKFFAGGPLGDGTQWTSWVHIDDCVRGMKFLLEDPSAQGVYNLTAPIPVMNYYIAERIGTVLERPALLPAPSFPIKMIFGEMSTIVLDGQRVMPERLIKQGFKFRYADVETALRDLLQEDEPVPA